MRMLRESSATARACLGTALDDVNSYGELVLSRSGSLSVNFLWAVSLGSAVVLPL